MERGNYCIQAYLSSIQHDNLDPLSLWPIQLKWLTLNQIRVFEITSGVNSSYKNNLRAVYYSRASMLDVREVHSFAITPLSIPNQLQHTFLGGWDLVISHMKTQVWLVYHSPTRFWHNSLNTWARAHGHKLVAVTYLYVQLLRSVWQRKSVTKKVCRLKDRLKCYSTRAVKWS